MILLEEEVPTLVHGETMTPAEFMRRWEAHPEIKHAELVGGRIVMPPPVGADHCFSEGQIGTWLGTYAATTPGCASGHNPTTFLGDDVLQPDVNLIILPEWGGASWIEKNYLHGCPELIAELAKSTIDRDLTTRREMLEKAGVKEYLVVNLKDREVRWHCMIDGVYQLLAPALNARKPQ
jgi:Uma2 family endonuclease